MGDGCGDAPGAVLQLAGEELRGHAGLAVRGEGEVVPVGVGLHQREVVLDRLGGQRQDRGGEAAAEQIAALGGQFADGAALGVRGERLETVVDAFGGEFPECLREPLVGHLVGHGVLLKIG